MTVWVGYGRVAGNYHCVRLREWVYGRLWVCGVGGLTAVASKCMVVAGCEVYGK
jgi:hypothetical protein